MTSQLDEVLLQELLHQGGMQAPAPGSDDYEKVIHSADSSMPLAIGVVTPAETAGWIYCWNTKTGERVAVNGSSIPTQLKKRHDDGTQAFVFYDPKIILPQRGLFYCLLSKDSPKRQVADSYGFAYCEKGLNSPFEVERHMRHRHLTEHETLIAQQTEQIRQEAEQARLDDRVWQRELLTSVAGARVQVAPKEKVIYTRYCGTCNRKFESAAAGAAVSKLRKHQRQTNHEGMRDA